MTNALFPATKGLNWTVRKNPEFSSIEKFNVSGKRVTYPNFNDPRWNFDLSWDYVRDDQSAINAAFSDLRAIQGFFGSVKGKFDTWLFEDPDDNSVSSQWFGDGDGATTAFQLKRNFGGMFENIRSPKVVNSSGPAVYMNDWQGGTNYLKQSQDFTQSVWTKQNNCVVTANAMLAPDGTMTADLITNGVSAFGSQAVYQTWVTSDGVTRWTFTFYVLGYGANDKVSFGIFNTTDGVFIASTTSVLSGSATITGSGQFMASGLSTTAWTRVSVTMNAAAVSGKQLTAFIYVGDPTNKTVGITNVVWGAQCEPSTTASNYVKTSTTAPVGATQMYPYSRTNLWLQSEAFDSASWAKIGIGSVSVNSGTLTPAGTTTGDILVEDTSTGGHYIGQNEGLTTDSRALSVYAHAVSGGRQWIYLQIGNNSVAYFNISTGAVGTVGGGATAICTYAGNGWYRCVLYGAGGTNTNRLIGLASANGTASYTGSGTNAVLIWGAQNEALTNFSTGATRYIPTTTAQVSVTDYSISSTGLITFASAPAAGSFVSWTGNFYFRCAFIDDMCDAEQFLKKLWELRSLQFRTVAQ